MKLVEELINRAATADAKMGRLAHQEQNAERRKKAFSNIENQLDRMMQDGVLSSEEIESAKAQFRQAGLDTSTLENLALQMQDMDGVTGVEVDSDMRLAFDEQFREAKASLDNPWFNFQAQELVGEYKESIDLAARVQKAEHEMYMAAIRNMKA